MAIGLAGLPTELIGYIAAQLEPADLETFSLVCKQIHAQTYHYVERSRYEGIQTDLSLRSLENIKKEIARHPQAKNYTRRLTIRLCCRSIVGDGFDWHRDSSSLVLPTSPGVLALQEILVNDLPKCRDIRVESCCEDEPNVYFNVFTDAYTGSVALATIFLIIAQTGLAVKSFWVDLFSRNTDLLHGLGRSLMQYREPLFVTAWGQLRNLTLSDPFSSLCDDWAFELVSCASNLRSLRLYLRLSDCRHFISRIASTVSLPRLQELMFGVAHLTIQDLSTFLFHFPTIHTLELWQVGLIGTDLWAPIFREMKTKLPHLAHIRLLSILQRQNYLGFEILSDKPVQSPTGIRKFTLEGPITRYGGKAGVTYRGTGMHEALEILAETAEILARNEP